MAPQSLTLRGPGRLGLPQPPPPYVTQAWHGFPMAAGMSDRMASVFESLRCISLPSWRSEIQNGSQRAKTKLNFPSGGPRGKICPVFFSFWRLLGFPGSWPHTPQTSAPIITSLLPSDEDPCEYIGATWTVQESLLSQDPLTSSLCKSPVPHKGPEAWVSQALGHGLLWWFLLCLPQAPCFFQLELFEHI